MIVRHNRNAREPPQPFAADAGGKVGGAQVDRHRSERAHGIDAEPYAGRCAAAGYVRDIVEHSGGGFEMHQPDPGWRRGTEEPALDLAPIERPAPRPPGDVEPKPAARRMIDEALAELAVAQNQSLRSFQLQLAGDHVVRQRSAAEQQRCMRRTGEFADQSADPGQLRSEAARTVRLGCGAHRLSRGGARLDRSGKQVQHVRQEEPASAAGG